MLKQITAISCALLMMSSGVQAKEEPSDPLEPVNRAVFTFNEYADRFLLKPVAQAYGYAVPDIGKQGVSNVLSNLGQPVTFANSVLQGDPQNAFSSLWSFIINSTLGVGGLFDFAGANTDLRVNNEDFGQTLGVWGVGSGPYIVLPLFGPSNVRDTFGRVADIAADPVTYIDDDKIVIGRAALSGVHGRYKALGLVDDIYETSFDPYATFRSAYAQRRHAQIHNTHSSD